MARLTIGLPVYNGAATLARSLDALLTQTFQDFILVVNDNASTDATRDVCARYCALDARVRYFRNEETVTWYENFDITLRRADTPYFMWATHDDLWSPRFAEANIALLEGDPGAICSVSKVVYFFPGGPEAVAPDTIALTGTPGQRLATYFRTITHCARLYGVYRTAALRAAWPRRLRIYGADWLAVALTLMQGDHLEVDEVLLRREAQPAGHYIDRMGRTDGFRPNVLDWLVPLIRLDRELFRRVPFWVFVSALPALLRVNVRQSLELYVHTLPAVKPLLRFVRKAVMLGRQ
jgi:glycosyltransferase involved in cell wall biosynthesis